MPTKKGDFVLLNYTCKVKESGEVVDTTMESVAKEAGLHHEHEHKGEKEEHVYEPMFLILGESWVPKGFDEGVIGLEAEKTLALEVPPEKAYGVRDPSKIKLLPLRRFKKEGFEPVPGMQVDIDRKPATIRSVGAGRVQVDFNHPLAGKTLLYDLKVEKIMDAKEEKARAIIHRRIPSVPAEKFIITLSDQVVIDMPEDALFLEGIQLAKRSIASDFQKFMPEFEKVSFMETFKKPSAPSEHKPQQAEDPKSK
jgi:peptidylprolyl isomerase